MVAGEHRPPGPGAVSVSAFQLGREVLGHPVGVEEDGQELDDAVFPPIRIQPSLVSVVMVAAESTAVAKVAMSSRLRPALRIESGERTSHTVRVLARL